EPTRRTAPRPACVTMRTRNPDYAARGGWKMAEEMWTVNPSDVSGITEPESRRGIASGIRVEQSFAWVETVIGAVRGCSGSMGRFEHPGPWQGSRGSAGSLGAAWE